MTTLRELKVKYPNKITTSGNVYKIEGMGYYKQKTTFFGLETYCKDLSDEWHSTDFNSLVEYLKQIW